MTSPPELVWQPCQHQLAKNSITVQQQGDSLTKNQATSELTEAHKELALPTESGRKEMSNEVKKAKKATFTTEIVNGKRVFTAVNKRAHYVAKRVGKRSKLTLADMRKTKGLGSYRMYQWTDGALKPIKF